MSELKVAKRYAKSFLDLGREKNAMEEMNRDMQSLLAVCRASKDFSLMLKNPLIQTDKKHNILVKLFGASFGKTSMAFVEIILKKRREIYLEEIAAEVVAQYKAIKGIATALVVTASGIDDKIRNEIKEKVKQITKSEVALEEKVNPDLIGGFVLRFGDVQYDSSVARALNMYRMNFSKNLYQSKIWKK